MRIFALISCHPSDNFNSNKFQMFAFISRNTTIHGQVSYFSFSARSMPLNQTCIWVKKADVDHLCMASRVLNYLLMRGMNIWAAIHLGANCCSGFKIRCQCLRGAKWKETPNLKKRYLPVEKCALNSHFCIVFTKVNGVRHLKRDKIIFSYVTAENLQTQRKIDY